MYKLPGYTVFFEENGAIYVSSKMYQNTIKITDKKLQDEFHSILRQGGCETLSSPLTNLLYEQGMIATTEEIQANLRQAQQLLEETLILTIMPTEGCNFRCIYCYEEHTSINMQRETIDQILAYLENEASKYKTVKIGWFGGEPTLCKDVVLEISSFTQKLAEKYGLCFESSMTTNGYLLDLHSFEEYYRVGIRSYQVTLDGWDHDRMRPHVTGKGTLDVILQNLIDLSKLPKDKYQFEVCIRHNILVGDNDMSWYDHLYKLFGADSRFSILVHPIDDWGGESVKKLNLSSYHGLGDTIAKHICYLETIGMRHANHTEEPFSQICYASFPHSMVFRASGKIEKCTVALDHPKNQLGYVDDEKGIVLDEAMNRLWSAHPIKTECASCTQALSCLNLSCKRNTVLYGASNCNYICAYQ